LYWFGSVFYKRNYFIYLDERTGGEIQPGAGKLFWLATAASLACGAFLGREWIRDELLRNFDAMTFTRSLTP
jgi:hypothetical protein